MMKEKMMGVYTKGEENFNFNFYTELSTTKKVEFVNTVVGLVLVEDNYNFIIRNLVTDFAILDVFTDIDTEPLWKSSQFIEDVENFLEETNIIDVVKANVDVELFEELNKAIDLNLEYKTGIHPSPLNEALTSLVNTLERKMEEFDMSGAMEMMQAFNGISGDLTPENIVKAYMDTSIAKKNAIEVEESKKNKAAIVEKVAESFEEFKRKK